MLPKLRQFGERSRGGMADVFISYKREEIAWAARVAQALSEEGFSAFYDLDDDGIHAGEQWDKRLEQELAAAKCCVVLWSSASTESPNVRSEARRANNRGILVPAKINACQAPLGLDALQEADLRQWRGDRADAQWRFLVDRGVARKVGRAGRPPKPTASPPPPPPRAQPLPLPEGVPSTPGLPRWAIPAGASGLALVALLAWSPWNRIGPPAETAPSVVAEAPETAPDATGAAQLGAQPSPPAGVPDARSTSASTRAPVLASGQAPAAFQLFRDCADCPEMVALPGDTFRMGDDASGESNEKPARDVRLRGFAAGRFEVTRGEYAAFVSATGRADPQVTGNTYCTWRSPGFTQSDRDPVTCVNTADAEAYAAWLSQRTGKTYRLLTEAQWEYAARGGTSSSWSFGDDESQLGAHAWFTSNSNNRTQPVGGKRANPFGLYDVHGNVSEWVRDCNQDTYRGLGSTDPVNESGACSWRVLRGASWVGDPDWLRSAFRRSDPSSLRHDDIGFRLARTL